MTSHTVTLSNPDSFYPFTVWALSPERAPMALDSYRTRAGAEHAAHLMRTGAAHHAPHALTGLRITPRAAPAPRAMFTLTGPHAA